ncbi:MAG: putative membrane protein [Gammaproteobacteria bacterium]|jgi:uncharacterized membrane protein
MHPLKVVSLISLAGLFFSQSTLLFVSNSDNLLIWTLILILPLLLPVKGLLRDNRYTYKWIGFLTLFYFCIGVSELVSSPAFRLYALLTLTFSIGLFLSSIYYTRYLRSQ